MSHIFISYSRGDKDYAHKLEAALEKQGFEVWIDDRIDYGTEWPDVVEQHVDTCAAFIVIMTPRSKGSLWVKRELARAQDKGKPIFPILLEGDKWFVVQTTQYVDVRHGRLPSKRFYDRLARVVPPRAAAPDAPATPTPEAPVTPAPAVAEKPKVLAPSLPFEPEMILIPAGEFRMGSDPAKDRHAREEEQPQHNLYLPDYYIAKTPVTNAQYLAFVQAVDQTELDRWEGGKPMRGKEDHPVIYVSWYDAHGYCRWLAENTGKPYRLSSEAEWEKAARGTDGRIHPWGDDPPSGGLCNFGAADRGTTPVGGYSPRGDSPFGCADMAGNVWEWTRSELRDYPYNPGDGREGKRASSFGLRVLRGGAFDNDARWVRCACRLGRNPVYRDGYYGFRVVWSPG